MLSDFRVIFTTWNEKWSLHSFDFMFLFLWVKLNSKKYLSQAEWHMSLIPVLVRQRQDDHYEFEARLFVKYSYFGIIFSYTVKMCLCPFSLA